MMRFFILFTTAFFSTWLCCCSTDKGNLAINEDMKMTLAAGEASVTKVTASGDENAYSFIVTVQSPDTGCDQYADWWEVVDLEGNLIYRRILAHSHVNEQPFSRSGGAVEIAETTQVYVRAHLSNTGYGSTVQKGSVANGFTAAELDVEFAQNLTETDPLPNGCAF